MAAENLTNITNLDPDPERFAYLYNNLAAYFLTWYLPLVLIVGIFGNTVILGFLIISRIFPKTVLLWLVSICIGDLLVLHSDALRMLVKVWGNGWDFRDISGFSCRTHNYISNFALIWSAYMQTGISFQRLYMILWPLKARMHLTFRKVFSVWLSVGILVTLPYTPYLLFWDLNKDTGDCEPEDKWYYYVTTLIDLIVWGLVPLISMTLATTLIIAKMYRREASMAACTHQDHHTGTASGNKKSNGASKSHSDNANHTTQLLVGLNLLYMLSTYPLLIYIMYLNFGLENKVGITIPQKVHRFIYYLLRSFCYVNSSFDWIFYTVSGATFRKRALQLLSRMCCRNKTLRCHETASTFARHPDDHENANTAL